MKLLKFLKKLFQTRKKEEERRLEEEIKRGLKELEKTSAKRGEAKKRALKTGPKIEKKRILKKLGKKPLKTKRGVKRKEPEKIKKIPEVKGKEKEIKLKLEKKGLIISGKTYYLETNIDRLLRLVQDRKKVNVSEAAKIFKVPEEKIEEWGSILESHELIESHYPAFGKPVLRVLKIKERKKEKKGK